MEKKKVASIWTILLVLFLVFLIYQSAFSWNDKAPLQKAEIEELESDETVFMTIKNKHYFVQNSSMQSIREALEMWSFDEDRGRVELKHSSLMPTDKTKMMLIYDRGYNSFERDSSVLSLINFPYNHYFEGEKMFVVTGVSAKGDVYMSYGDKKIHLKPGETYWTYSTEGYKLTKTTIENYGLYDKDQFKIMGEVDEDDKNNDDKENGTKELNQEERKLKYKSQPLVEVED